MKNAASPEDIESNWLFPKIAVHKYPQSKISSNHRDDIGISFEESDYLTSSK